MEQLLAALFEEGTPSIVPKIINGALLVRCGIVTACVLHNLGAQPLPLTP